MRKIVGILFFLLFSTSLVSAQKYRLGQRPVKENPADYTIPVHISATRFRPCATVGINAECGEGVYVDATLNGKKLELFGAVDKSDLRLINPGDYVARLVKKTRDGGSAVLGQEYYVLLPDKTAWICSITGFSE
ncbi:MAG TPA: hypothetical protein VMU48_15675 [Terracidiphilus sp.]|nr:hypothetical protein [Terracidiphilus sp.]